jgi:hypothetical protein
MEEGPAKAKRLGELLGCDGENSRELVDCLRTRPAHQIVQQVKYFQVNKRLFSEVDKLYQIKEYLQVLSLSACVNKG